ncbi:hypothetical protein ASG11_15530 [Sphingomonas sp. Leaf357]|nr:hypothetical protein ASG11_15530 [Sphingomonas sp. Leaf357]
MDREYRELATETSYISAVSDLASIARSRRNILQLSQSHIAEQASVGRRFIIDFESGKPSIQMDKVFQVCYALDIELMAKRSRQKNKLLVPVEFMGRAR